MRDLDLIGEGDDWPCGVVLLAMNSFTHNIVILWQVLLVELRGELGVLQEVVQHSRLLEI